MGFGFSSYYPIGRTGWNFPIVQWRSIIGGNLVGVVIVVSYLVGRDRVGLVGRVLGIKHASLHENLTAHSCLT